ncbi:hypothetical protein [Haloferula sp.]|uniref:hypothetical protein n=1 Tax=Haloferula sp. TaxID=2497595 RepID=UPI003C7686F9
MKYLKVYHAATRAAPFTEASSKELGTWLLLALYCAEHENGGVIVGGGSMSERAMLKSIGVTPPELKEAYSGLWEIEGEDIIVQGYSVEDEEKYRARREQGSRGGKKRAENQANASANGQANAQAIEHHITSPDLKESNPTLSKARPSEESSGLPVEVIRKLEMVKGVGGVSVGPEVAGWHKSRFVGEVTQFGLSEADGISAWSVFEKGRGRDQSGQSIRDVGLWARRLIDGRHRRSS